ncbi:MAG: bifunctional UDP-sugar hydrolase/5'-nucleotidase [Acidobacteriota bacterium]|nr:bifunctional UDP-sugar hydrolase/5'-nucleotidase [Acidobacteriota bacterium]
MTLSIVGTTDLHGRVFPRDGRGGVALLGGYLRNLRKARARDGGAVLLVDAGDTFEGGIASNLSEGALVVDAYNALGYDALAVGNHEFDYGALDTGSGDDVPSDMRGALKAAAARAWFPFLAANLIDETTGRAVAWPNVRPSTLIETAGLRVGIVGVMTYDALTKTLAANVQGLATAPLAPSVAREASQLRQRGADVVLVVAHAGGWCGRFDDPADLSVCDDDAEIFQLARRLPHGLVDAIVAGHTHAGVAHEVAGIPIVQAYSRGAAFARVDLSVARGTGVVSARIFAPQALCAAVDLDGACVADGSPSPFYEGAPVAPDPSMMMAMQPELARVQRWREVSLGIILETPLARNRDGLESPLGNLFADAFLAAVPGADVAIGMGARRGGLRADLPAGALTRGSLYDVFPFDNRLVTVSLTGAQLRQVLTGMVVRGRRGVPGVSGIRVRVTCEENNPEVDIVKVSGEVVDPAETLIVATTDFFARRARFDRGSMRPALGPALAAAPLVRDAAARWLTARGGRLRAADVADPPRWEPLDGGACLAD